MAVADSEPRYSRHQDKRDFRLWPNGSGTLLSNPKNHLTPSMYILSSSLSLSSAYARPNSTRLPYHPQSSHPTYRCQSSCESIEIGVRVPRSFAVARGRLLDARAPAPRANMNMKQEGVSLRPSVKIPCSSSMDIGRTDGRTRIAAAKRMQSAAADSASFDPIGKEEDLARGRRGRWWRRRCISWRFEAATPDETDQCRDLRERPSKTSSCRQDNQN